MNPPPVTHEARALHTLVRRQELFARRQYEPVVSSVTLRDASAVWFGVGVATETASRGLPIDVMILVYAQEMVRRELGLPMGRILVADTNAHASGVPSLDVRRCADDTMTALRRVVTALNFPVSIQLASSLAGYEELDAVLGDHTIDNPYLAYQMAQTEVLRQQGASVKVGWALSSCMYDETFFDRTYARLFGDNVSFVYTVGGRTLDERRPRACPYLCEDLSNRVLLHPRNTDALDALRNNNNAPAARGYRRLLDKLSRAHLRLTGENLGSAVVYARAMQSLTLRPPTEWPSTQPHVASAGITQSAAP